MKRSSRTRAGVTLAELIVATALAAIVMASLVSVTSSALKMWTRGERTRDARELGSAALEVMHEDLSALHPTAEGDLVVDWEPFDLDRDGIIERSWPRLRFVRDASAAELSAIERRQLASNARAAIAEARRKAGLEEIEGELTEDDLLESAGRTLQDAALGGGGARDIDGTALVEVLYAVVPDGREGDERFTGTLVRQERVHTAGTVHALTEDGALDSRGYPDLNEAREVVSGVLWLQPLLATQTTRVALPTASDPAPPSGSSGWRIHDGLGTAATSWDAWRRARPDVEASVWNEPAPGMPSRGSRPLLPRAIRLEIEVQRAADRARAPRLLESVEETRSTFEVSNGSLLQRAVGRHVLIAGEWVQLVSVSGDLATVRRAQRGTAARALPSGTSLLFGEPLAIEIAVPVHDDDWRLVAEVRSVEANDE